MSSRFRCAAFTILSFTAAAMRRTGGRNGSSMQCKSLRSYGTRLTEGVGAPLLRTTADPSPVALLRAKPFNSWDLRSVCVINVRDEAFALHARHLAIHAR